MTMQSVSIRHVLLLVGVALVLPRAASASTESCTQAHAGGQREENAGRLKEALTYFEECAADADCPLPIRNECTSLYSKVEARLPTLVFSVVDDTGNDVTDVRISSADTEIANGLDGRPIAINPGRHELRYELPGGQVITKGVVVRQGEKDRIVAVKLPRTEFASSAPAQVSTEPTEPLATEPDKRFTVPLASWVAYGVGAAALVSWGTFGLLGRGQEQDLVDCSPTCDPSKRDDFDVMKRNYLIADISLGVGAAAVVAGTVMLLTMGRRSSRADATTGVSKRSLSFSPVRMGRDGGGLAFEGRY